MSLSIWIYHSMRYNIMINLNHFYQAWEGGKMLEKIKDVTYKVAIYIRLSKEDLDRGYDDSESVKNQKKLLVEYVENLGWQYELVDIYIDQGYTGTNFNRPAFKRMINDINNGKVNMVVTKDLSRLMVSRKQSKVYISN